MKQVVSPSEPDVADGVRLSGRYKVAVLQKALDVLEVVAFSRGAIALQEICKRTGFPKATVFRLLSNLEERGYVCRNARNAYYLGSRSQLLGAVPSRGQHLRESAQAQMHQLRDRFGHTVSLGIRLADQILYIETVEGSNALRFVEPPGTLGPLHATALGKVLLAGCDTETCSAVAARLDYKALTAKTIKDPEALIAAVSEARKLGYALDDEESVLGARCVAVPVLDSAGRTLAAMSISGPAGSFDRQVIAETVEILATCSRNITSQMEEGASMT